MSLFQIESMCRLRAQVVCTFPVLFSALRETRQVFFFFSPGFNIYCNTKEFEERKGAQESVYMHGNVLTFEIYILSRCMQVFISNFFFITSFSFIFDIFDISSIHKESNKKGQPLDILE